MKGQSIRSVWNGIRIIQKRMNTDRFYEIRIIFHILYQIIEFQTVTQSQRYDFLHTFPHFSKCDFFSSTLVLCLIKSLKESFLLPAVMESAALIVMVILGIEYVCRTENEYDLSISKK